MESSRITMGKMPFSSFVHTHFWVCPFFAAVLPSLNVLNASSPASSTCLSSATLRSTVQSKRLLRASLSCGTWRVRGRCERCWLGWGPIIATPPPL